MGELIDLLHLFFVSLCLQGIVPLLVGATLVAEERKQETWDWQLSLPVSRRLQWTVKLAVATAIVLTLTFAIQPLLDLIVSNILNGEVRLSLGGASHIVWTPSYFAKMNALYYGIPLALMVCAAFASTLTRFRQFRG
jgi:ABC-type transport system involved in multi-copper enzyme maturation permease subunit